jgi:hypothetical protein
LKDLDVVVYIVIGQWDSVKKRRRLKRAACISTLSIGMWFRCCGGV